MEIRGGDSPDVPMVSRAEAMLVTFPKLARGLIPEGDIIVRSLSEADDQTVVIEGSSGTDRIVFVANPRDSLRLFKVERVSEVSGGEFLVGRVLGDGRGIQDVLCGIFFNTTENRFTRIYRIPMEAGVNIADWKTAEGRLTETTPKLLTNNNRLLPSSS